MLRFGYLSIVLLFLSACSSTFTGRRGDIVNPVSHIVQPSGLPQPMAVLQTHPGPQVPIESMVEQPATIEQAITKRIWIAPHDNAHGDRIHGHYVDVLYQEPRFRPLPEGTARVPIVPTFEPGSPVDTLSAVPTRLSPLPVSQKPGRASPSEHTQPDPFPPAVREQLEALRKRLGSSFPPTSSVSDQRPEDRP